MASIIIQGTRVELTEECPNAEMYDGADMKAEWCRAGTIWRHDYLPTFRRHTMDNTGRSCPTCRGTGEVLTDEGRTIIELVRTWLPE